MGLVEKKGNSFNAASMKRKNWRWVSLSETHYQMFSVSHRCQSQTMQIREGIEKKIEKGQKMTCSMSFCIILLGDGIWQASKIGCKVKCQKCTNLLSNYRRCGLEMWVYSTQWLPKPSYQALISTSNASRGHAVASKLQYTHTAIRIVHAEPEVIWKEDIIPYIYQLCRLVHQSRHLSKYCTFKGNRSNGLGVDKQWCCKRRHTVIAETGHAANWQIPD